MAPNPTLDLAYNYAQYTRRNIFLTGKAGTGKTTFLRHLQSTSRKRLVIVAPTGVAAINAGGVTIHSFFQIAPGLLLPETALSGNGGEKQKYQYSKHKINILRTIDLLIIDEISMVRADLLDAIDGILRRYQNRNLPFGGVQLLMIGDLQQLAPVTTENEWQILKQYYPTPYFFDSIALKKTNYTTIELTHVYRQADQAFIDILNHVRENRLDTTTLQQLNARFQPDFRPKENDGYITLTTHNYQAQEINSRKLKALPTQEMRYVATIQGDFPQMSYPTDEELILKVGAQVMFCKNDPGIEKRYYNGKIGRIVRLGRDVVTVSCPPDDSHASDEEILIDVGAQEWTNAKYVTDATTGAITEEIAGTFSQIPLKTAWAITIHKSQGLTFERAIINAGSAFSHGQVYVALSRCRTLEGMVLSTPITPGAVMNDPNIICYNRFIEQNHPTPEQLTTDRQQYIADILCEIFDFSAFMTRFNYFTRLADEYLNNLYPNYVNRCKNIASSVQQELADVGTRFQTQIRRLILETEDFSQNAVLQERIVKGFAYYETTMTHLLGELFETGLPEIGNKKNRQQIEREFSLLQNDYILKARLCAQCVHGFSLQTYWDVKAKTLMQQESDSPSSRKKTSSTESGSSKRKSEKVQKITVGLNDDIRHPELHDELRKWRLDKAVANKVAPYTVLQNKVLLGIANLLPDNSKQLLSISGFGPKLLQSYGDELLEMVRQYKERSGMEY